MGWNWRHKKTTCAGSVLFRGSVAPRADEFTHLERRGFAIVAAEPGRAAHWALRISHPELGEADVVCLPEALDDELCHDADLDIESLYTLHAVTGDEAGDEAVIWLHSHGLAEIGLFDFDVLRPSEDLLGRGRDALRAVAFAILDGAVS